MMIMKILTKIHKLHTGPHVRSQDKILVWAYTRNPLLQLGFIT